MKKTHYFGIFGIIFLAAYCWIMPISWFHKTAPEGKYGNVKFFEWKYLLGKCDGDIHASLWGTMSLETFEKLTRGKNEYFDYRFTDGKKKSLSIRVEADHLRIDFDDNNLRLDGCSELHSGSIDIPLAAISELNGNYKGPKMHPGVTSDEPFRLMPWERSFIKIQTKDLPL